MATTLEGNAEVFQGGVVKSYSPKKLRQIKAKAQRYFKSRTAYSPKEMQQIWAKVQRYLNSEDTKYSQDQFDRLHAKVDCGPATRFTNQVRRAIGLPEQPVSRKFR